MSRHPVGMAVVLLLSAGSLTWASRVEPALVAASQLLEETARKDNEDEAQQKLQAGGNIAARLDGDGVVGEEEVSLAGAWTPMSTWEPMWHPYLVLFLIHCVFAVFATWASYRVPLVLLIVLACSGLLWPISWMFKLNIWDAKHFPLSGDWWMTFIKWVIVDATAGIPVLAVKHYDFSQTVNTAVGYGIYIILGSNVAWTMIYKVDGYVRMWNTFVGGVLILSLATHCVAQSRHGKPLLEKINGMPYGRGTTLLWLISYTVWNAMFVMDFSMGMILQDILFWTMMLIYQMMDEDPLQIEFYFAFARPVQLSTYIPVGCWLGIIPFFANAQPLANSAPLHVNNHSFFLFLNMANFVLALFTLFKAIVIFINGPPDMAGSKRLTQVSRN